MTAFHVLVITFTLFAMNVPTPCIFNDSNGDWFHSNRRLQYLWPDLQKRVCIATKVLALTFHKFSMINLSD